MQDFLDFFKQFISGKESNDEIISELLQSLSAKNIAVTRYGAYANYSFIYKTKKIFVLDYYGDEDSNELFDEDDERIKFGFAFVTDYRIHCVDFDREGNILSHKVALESLDDHVENHLGKRTYYHLRDSGIVSIRGKWESGRNGFEHEEAKNWASGERTGFELIDIKEWR